MTAATFADGAAERLSALLSARGGRPGAREKVGARRWVPTWPQLSESLVPDNRWSLQQVQHHRHRRKAKENPKTIEINRFEPLYLVRRVIWLMCVQLKLLSERFSSHTRSCRDAVASITDVCFPECVCVCVYGSFISFLPPYLLPSLWLSPSTPTRVHAHTQTRFPFSLLLYCHETGKSLF